MIRFFAILVFEAALWALAAETAVGDVVFTVDSIHDSADADTSDGACADSVGSCTLRAALEQANASAGADIINFNIAGGAYQFILPQSPLPDITAPVTINGYSQPGSSLGMPSIVIHGNGAGTAADGLKISAGSSAVRGLVISSFSRTGITLTIGGGNVIQGNFIGTGANGTTPFGNGAGGDFGVLSVRGGSRGC